MLKAENKKTATMAVFTILFEIKNNFYKRRANDKWTLDNSEHFQIIKIYSSGMDSLSTSFNNLPALKWVLRRAGT